MSLAALLLIAAAAADLPMAELELWVARYYAGASAALKENVSCLTEDQQRWTHARDACPDEACRRRAHLERLAELHALQPGINLQRKLALPEAPALVWAIAPDPDPLMRPKLASRAQRVEGRLIYGGDNDGGYFLESGPQERYLLITDMGLDGANAMALPTLAKVNAQARIAASGRVAPEGHKPFFDRRYCIYLHRLP
jgi:hypothetical protein